ncbi:50S ribosomal protein L29 [bacterium DOLZORAL124_38_8]|nr:MAG: 50S ribosomal protein L29 [bacterium DOLZORAL124_38_8]
MKFIQDLRVMTVGQLHKELAAVRRDLAVARFHVRTGQSKEVAKVQGLRKHIAQIKTVLSEK